MILSRYHVVLSALGTALLLAASATAQAPPGPLPPTPGVKPQPRPQIRVQVDLVTTPVTVRSATGEILINLQQHDFRVFDNGVEQRIERFDLGGEPLSLALVFESSSRVEVLLPAVKRSGIVFTETLMGTFGEAAVVGFDDTVNVLVPFSEDKEAIQKSINTLRMGTSGARLYDALLNAVNLLRQRPESRRRVIAAVSEATDTGSEAPLGDVLRQAQLSNITIYSVTLSSTAAQLRGETTARGPSSPTPPGTFGRPGIPGSVQTPTSEQQRSGNINVLELAKWLVERAANVVGDNALEAAAAATGGMNVGTFRGRSIETAVDQIGAELHQQYTLSYRPAGVSQSGFHEVRVEVSRKGTHVRARQGYYIPAPETR